MSHYRGQVAVEELGFYGRDVHVNLIRQKRLIAGVERLSQLPDQLRDEVLSIPDRVAQGALFKDAVALAEEKGLTPRTNKFNAFVAGAIER